MVDKTVWLIWNDDDGPAPGTIAATREEVVGSGPSPDRLKEIGSRIVRATLSLDDEQ